MVRLIGKRFFTAYDGAASQGEHLPFWGRSVEGSPTRGKKAGTTHSQPKVAHKMFFAPSGETPWPITPERGHSSEWKGPQSYAANRVPISLSIPEKIVTKMLVKGDSVDRYGSEWYGWKGHSILYNSAIYTIWLSWTVFELQANIWHHRFSKIVTPTPAAHVYRSPPKVYRMLPPPVSLDV